jgi:hypothetical protein
MCGGPLIRAQRRWCSTRCCNTHARIVETAKMLKRLKANPPPAGALRDRLAELVKAEQNGTRPPALKRPDRLRL